MPRVKMTQMTENREMTQMWRQLLTLGLRLKVLNMTRMKMTQMTADREMPQIRRYSRCLPLA
jgi:hypothetical protein